jgi:hypothetical protein
MGIGASTAAGLENPFPIEPAMEKDLLRLSFVVSRLLNKPDLYDLNNLARPGACGDYAVFLKKKIERQLLPFVLDLSGSSSAITMMYGNPLKSFDTVEKRRAACGILADTMVRLVSIVVACLASLQFESPRAREAAGVPAALPIQRGGGGESDIIDWLTTNRYIQPGAVPATVGTGRYVIPLQDPANEGSAPANAPIFTLQLNRTPETDGTFTGYITARGGRGYEYTEQPEMPTAGFLKIHFLKPIVLVPGTTTSILPIQVVDGTGATWLCGALYTYAFISLSAANTEKYLFDALGAIFRKAQGDTRASDTPLEKREDIRQADAIFNTARRTRDIQPILTALTPYLSATVPGFRPFTAPAAVPGYPPMVPPGYYPPMAAPGYYPPMAAPGTPYRPIAPLARRPISYGAAALGVPGELTAGEYVIPPPAAKTILTTFRKHAGEIGAANNPAQIRATLLAGQVMRDRTIQTRICQDPYWNASTLASVYPWATFQFLCLENYRTLGGPTLAPRVVPTPAVPGSAAAPAAPALAGAPTSRVTFRKEWGDFIQALGTIYNGTNKLPRLLRNIDKPRAPLEELRFVDVAKTNGCDRLSTGQSPRARFQEIQNGVLRLQGLYEEHSKEVWKLLNSLIVIIVDPDTNTEMVRLNPKIFTSGDTTADYIDEKASEAVELLKEYYVAVERTYTDTIQNMRVIS